MGVTGLNSEQIVIDGATYALGQEPYLLTPGPLTTSLRTKAAMLKDWGSWDDDFKAVTKAVRAGLVALCAGGDEYDCVPIQGSGTYAVEAALASFVPRDGKILILMNGAYGQRAAKIMEYLGRAYSILDKGDYAPPTPDEVDAILTGDPAIDYVFIVHCETSSGILNPVKEIGEVVARHGRKYFIDSMSAFGAVPLEAPDIPFDVMVSSANKCIEGVPGFGFVLAKISLLEAAKGNAHSLSLDVHDQWAHMNKTGQWRYTPPTHVLVAFYEALKQHTEQGGVAGRLKRYSENRDILISGMRGLGFETLLDDRWLSPIITTFFSPRDPNFEFARFYNEIKSRGYIIYPGKLTAADSFRIGCIGMLDASVMKGVIKAVADALAVMKVTDCRPPEGVRDIT